jgi:hypothetical protein
MKHLTVGVLCLLLGITGYGQGRPSKPTTPRSAINRDYVGLEKMANLSPEDPQVEWFHQNTLLVKDNEAILDKVPISIKQRKKSYSASDGGFLTYRARFFEKDNQMFVGLRLIRCDYVLLPLGHDPYREIKTYPVKFLPGYVEIDGVQYKRKKSSGIRHGELLRLRSQEPMEK